MRRKVAVVLIIALILPLLSGCWSRREIEDLAFVSSIGVDRVKVKGKNKYLITLGILRPGQMGGAMGGGGGTQQGIPVWRITATGDTFHDAERNISTRSPRKIFLGHARDIFVGEALAREGLHKVLDLPLRHKDVRLRTHILIVKGRAVDLMAAVPELEPSLSEEASGVARLTSQRVSKFFVDDLNQVTDDIITPGVDPLMAKVEVILPRPQQPGNPRPNPAVVYRGGAVIRKDKLVGWLGDNETKGYLWIKGKAVSGIVPLKLHRKKEPDVSIEMVRSASNIKVRAEGDKVFVKVDIKAEANLGDCEEPDKITTPEGIKTLEKLYKKEVRRQALAAVKKAQEFKADIFGFGEKLHISDPKTWKKFEKNWEDHFSRAEVHISVNAKIRRTGLISETIVPK